MTPAGVVRIAWQSPTVLYLRVHGLGTMYTAAGMSSFLTMAVEEGCSDVTVDLVDCTGMDSTFMGIMAGAAQDLADRGRGGIVIVNASAKSRSLLEGLGLHYLLNIAEGSTEMPKLHFEDLPEVGALDFRDRLEVLRKAHEDLSRVTDENRETFRPFLDELEDRRDES
jgi:anti-anti-sigma regulatory factor